MKISTLVKRALKDGFKTKPAHGYKYLEDLPVGSLFETSSGTRGILLDSSINAKVVITDTEVKDYPDYYLGKRIISNKTEVKEIT
jgi:hypothetical protein|tara:strand:+ start:1824 stop:2078 length:255 start_codon:yes stop_codon:yes gene_type:complete